MVIKSTNEASCLPSTSYDDIEICSSQNLMIKTCQNQHDSWFNHMKTSIFWAGWSLDVDRYIAIYGLIYILMVIYTFTLIIINIYIYIDSPCLYIYIWFPYFDGDLPLFHHRKKPLQENCGQRLGTLQPVARNLAALRPRKGGGDWGGAKAYGTLGEIWGLAEKIMVFFMATI